MPVVTNTKAVHAGKWNTLESLWNCNATVVFKNQAGAVAKVRYGPGAFGWDSQKQRLDGSSRRLVVETMPSRVGARVQVRPDSNGTITYEYWTGVVQ